MRYETRIGFLFGVDVPCLGTDSETVDSFRSLLEGTFRLRNDPLSDPEAVEPLSSAVSILGALSSVSQLHYSKREGVRIFVIENENEVLARLHLAFPHYFMPPTNACYVCVCNVP